MSDTLSVVGAGTGRSNILVGEGAFSITMPSASDTFSLSDVSFTGNPRGCGAVLNNKGNAVLESVEASGLDTPICNHGTMRVVRSGVHDNTGSGINNLGQIEIVDSAITSNKSGTSSYGGALSNRGIALTTNTTISGNTAGYGSAVSSRDTTTHVQLEHVTLTNNASTTGSALYADFGSTITVRASILSNGSSPNCATADTASITSLGHNIDSGNACGFAAVGDHVTTDPRLSVLGRFGGGMLSQGPLSDSPAIDAAGTNCPSTDQRGVTRPLDGNNDGLSACDIGAHERVSVDQPPVADAGGPYTVLGDKSLTLNGSRSYDLKVESPFLSYYWDFGDGATGTGEKPTYTYQQLGTFPATLSVTDGVMQSEPATTTVTVKKTTHPRQTQAPISA